MKESFRRILVGLFFFIGITASVSFAQNDAFYTSLPKNSDAWRSFVEKNGDWNFATDAINNKPFKAFGQPIQINAFSAINKENAESAARQFINDNVSAFNIQNGDLELSSIMKVGQLWYVKFHQNYQGLRVVNSNLDLRIRDDAKVVSFGQKTFDDINISTIPTITTGTAQAVVCKEFNIEVPKSKQITLANELFILPVKSGKIYEYKLVYDMNVAQDLNQYKVYVDANNSALLQKRKLNTDAEANLQSLGFTHTKTPKDTMVYNMFPYQIFTANGILDTADWYGKAKIDIAKKSKISAKIEGKYFSITRDTASKNAKFVDSIAPGDNFTMLWNDSNSSRQERNIYFFANKAYEMLKEIDSTYTAMDFKMQVTLYFDTTGANASSGGQTIQFIGLGDKTDMMTDMPDVFFHEYGHSITKLLYDQISKTNNGILNLACNEALADINCADYTDNPKVGIGYISSSPSSYIRNIDNTKKYPADIVSDAHNTALILSGAYWDLRKATSLDYLKRISHFTKYGMPDGEDYGVAFLEWFFETITTDDNMYGDADLSNGSPHLKEIIKAFNNHNIGMNFYLSNSFLYNQIKDTLALNEKLPINGSIKEMSNFGYGFDSLLLVYSTDNFKTSATINVPRNNSGAFASYIPAMDSAVVVKYYFKAFYKDTTLPITLYANASTNEPYVYLVNYEKTFSDNFETNQGWTVGVSTDKATHGLWERCVPPTPTNYTSAYFPSSDYTTNGTYCFVTGKKIASWGDTTNITNGTTSLISPIYDVTNLKNPVLRFKTWLNGYDWSGSTSFAPKLSIFVSLDSGAKWTKVYQIATMDTVWQNIQIPVGDYVTTKNSLRVKFMLNPTVTGYSNVKAYLDEFQIWTPPYVVDVKEVESDASTLLCSIYPNPTNDVFNISYTSDKQIESISVYDFLGAKLNVPINIGASNSVINMSEVSSGSYIIKLNISGKSYYKTVNVIK